MNEARVKTRPETSGDISPGPGLTPRLPAYPDPSPSPSPSLPVPRVAPPVVEPGARPAAAPAAQKCINYTNVDVRAVREYFNLLKKLSV